MNFFAKELALIRTFQRSIEEIYGFVSAHVFREDGCYAVRTGKKRVYQDLIRHGKFGSYGWEPPAEVFECKSTAREWIKAFFDGEAYVNTHRNKFRIQVKSVNGRGLGQVRNLLAKHFNIDSKLYGPYRHSNSRYAPYFQLEILRKDSLVRYRDEINFYSPRKKSILAKLPGYPSQV